MKKLTVLFDFDGVICDTEAQYTNFWSGNGMKYLGIKDFGHLIKGQTLRQIFDRYLNGMEKAQAELVPALDEFERNMSYGYVPGAYEFLTALRSAGISTAIVTSSDHQKMSHVYRARPEIQELVDAILVSEDFKASKPDPECFLKGMERLGGRPEDTVVFEDSFHGLAAGRASGAHVVGLTTTNPREAIAPLCDMVIDDFRGLNTAALLKLIG